MKCNENLKDLREKNKKTVADVATALKVTKGAIYNYENGIRYINISQALFLSDFYNEPAEIIITAQRKHSKRVPTCKNRG